MEQRFIVAEAQSASTSTISFMGRDYLVLPVIALVEGVVTPGNVGKPELALMSEIEKSVEQWNGRPIVLNHPRRANSKGDLETVGANSPDMFDEYACGIIFNARVEDKKLKLDAYIDEDRCIQMGGQFQEAIDKVNAGDMLEVSTGMLADTEKKRGTYNGKSYEAVWRNIVPDHLALLPEMIGACSNDQGCGAPRINSETILEAQAKFLEERIKTLDLPKPSAGEKQEDFHSRCMGSAKAVKEFPDQSQRNAVCYSQWNRAKSKKHSDGEAIHNNLERWLDEGIIDELGLSSTEIGRLRTNDASCCAQCASGSSLSCERLGVNSTAMEIRANILSKARRPSFSGTESTSWGSVDKSISAYVDSYNSHNSGKEDGTDVSKLSGAAKKWIAAKSLLGDPSADNSRDLLFFPAVNPKTNKLNEGALRAIIGGRGAQAKESEGAVSSAQSMARSLLKSEFGVDLDESDDKKSNARALNCVLRDLFIAASSGISDHDKRTAIQHELDKRHTEAKKQGDYSHSGEQVMSVYDNEFVHSSWMDGSYHEVPYTMDSDTGKVMADFDNEKEVRPVTQFVATEPDQDGADDDDSNTVGDLGMPSALMPRTHSQENKEMTQATQQPAAIEQPKPKTLEEFIATAPPEFKGILTNAVGERDKRINEMIEKIVANKANTLSRDELKQMSLTEQGIKTVETIFHLASKDPAEPDADDEDKKKKAAAAQTHQPADYSGQPGAQRTATGAERELRAQNGEQETLAPEPPSLSAAMKENFKPRGGRAAA